MPFLPISSGFTNAKRPRGKMSFVPKKGISLKTAFFSVRPFGKRRPYPWQGKKPLADKVGDTTLEVMMRPYMLSAEYSPMSGLVKPKKSTKRERRLEKLNTAPKFGDYIWAQKKSRNWGIIGGTLGFFFAPNPMFGAAGGFAGGLGLYTLKHPKLVGQYKQEMWKKYGVKKKSIWKY